MSVISDKTIFVLDHTQYFSISSEDYIPLDYLKGKSNGGIENLSAATGVPANEQPQFSKSLWTCSVESSIEYCRIVWDLFPREKLVRFIVSDTAAHIVNTWNPTTQNMSHVINAMALVGVPQRNAPQSSEYSVVHGLRAAIEALAEPTERQQQPTPNKGRVICITSARDNPSMKSLEDIFHTVLLQQNTMATAQPNKLLVIDHCHLVIINMVPLGVETLVTGRPLLDLSKALSSEVHTSVAPDISNKLTHLIMEHYDLASTTVTGIPMKEEQNANSSANYDVEILHARNAHTVLCGNEVVLPTSIKEGAEYETVTLKWCTPRGCGSDAQLCMALHRVTPVDVTSRPSSCLINFLLNGRSVLLEMPRKTGGKITSHLLSAQGGEIFIHALQITRSCLDDLPSISEGPGGRLTDYRVTDFSSFAKSYRFVPLKGRNPDENLSKGRERLYRRSMYFPLTLGTSMLYNLMLNTDFLRKVTKENMDQNDEMLCQQQIFEQIYTPAKFGEILQFKNAGFKRMKDSKAKDQYKLLLHELELLIRSHATTQSHRGLLETVKNFRTAYVSATKSDTPEGVAHYKNFIRATTDSPLSPPHSMALSNPNTQTIPTPSVNQRSLLDLYLLAERNQTAKRLEFAGRLCTPIGQVAKLYPNFGAKEKEEPSVSQATA